MCSHKVKTLGFCARQSVSGLTRTHSLVNQSRDSIWTFGDVIALDAPNQIQLN